ncbi:glycoside hydrolase [Parachaetomium inaequale]|uniref:lytic cellulose monooxygenase (C4-dehydrogenating) n=1 Tax=Parachaetomium inaequale TaxID=2588326 RepID=A0AAN6PG07_9PEZI|nr:glycoside hydrolase [Parachaetomium inaequale]
MQSPLLFALGLATAFAPFSAAHTTFTTLFVDEVNQGDGTCIRMAKEGNVATHPIAGGLNAEDMACGRDGNTAVAFTCPAPAGAKLTLEFRMWADAAQPGSIDPSHLGPMAIYLKQVSDMKSDPAAGEGWFKIWDEGFDAAAKKWATEKLIDNNGLLSINLPSALPTGYYLARHEIITLQNVTNDKVDAQFYVGCAQLYVEGASSGGTIPSDKTVSIPGHITDPADPGLTFNVYTGDASTYQVAGPKVFFPTSSSANNKARQQQTGSKKQADDLVPATCLLKNANWCAAAVPVYTDEAGCWAGAEDCYRQLDECYNSAPPSGSRGCKVWEEQMCTVIQHACESGDVQGPPDQGEKLGDGVDQPVPGGKLPAAVNAGETGTTESGGGGDGDREEGAGEATPTPTSAGAGATPKPKCKSKARRRELLRRRMAFP